MGMFDFKDEVKKYSPVLEADELERELTFGDANDVVKLLHMLIKKRNNIYHGNESYSYLTKENTE
jgi:hypothetical protein